MSGHARSLPGVGRFFCWLEWHDFRVIDTNSGSAPINVEVYNGSVLLAAFVASDKTGAGELQVARSVDGVVDFKDGLVAGNVERLSYRGFLIKVPQ